MKQLFTLLALSCALYSCSSTEASSTSSDSTKVTESATPSKSKSTVATEPATKWEYWDKEDKMTSDKNYYASVDANEKIDFEFPYDGGSTASITIRNQDKQNDVMLQISKGQFNTGVDGGTIKVRFDDKKPSVYETSSPSDGSSEMVFINNGKKFLKELKASKRAIIQAEFFDSGIKTMEFNTAGFEWKH